MRLIKRYLFPLNGRTSWTVWIEIIQQFLRENQLTSHRFLYHFEETLFNGSIEECLPGCGCAKLRKECPALDELRIFRGREKGVFDSFWMTNVDLDDDQFTVEQLLPVVKKIQRGYGFSESALHFYDVDFFGRRTFFERKEPANDRIAEIEFYGSGISLHRSNYGGSSLSLDIDLLHNGEVLDAEPYRDALQKLLPECKVSSYTRVWLSKEEQRELERVKEKASPVIEQCRQFFQERIPCEEKQNANSTRYSLAKPMKVLASKYGYRYRQIWGGGLFGLEKRTARGNILRIDMDSGPSRYSLDVGLSYCGAGFGYPLSGSMCTPTNQKEADAAMEAVMCVVAEFEQKLLPELDACFPEAPVWYEPTMEPLWTF